MSKRVDHLPKNWLFSCLIGCFLTLIFWYTKYSANFWVLGKCEKNVILYQPDDLTSPSPFLVWQLIWRSTMTPNLLLYTGLIHRVLFDQLGRFELKYHFRILALSMVKTSRKSRYPKSFPWHFKIQTLCRIWDGADPKRKVFYGRLREKVDTQFRSLLKRTSDLTISTQFDALFECHFCSVKQPFLFREPIFTFSGKNFFLPRQNFLFFFHPIVQIVNSVSQILSHSVNLLTNISSLVFLLCLCQEEP